jgi:hypothetical protein
VSSPLGTTFNFLRRILEPLRQGRKSAQPTSRAPSHGVVLHTIASDGDIHGRRRSAQRKLTLLRPCAPRYGRRDFEPHPSDSASFFFTMESVGWDAGVTGRQFN